MRTRYAGLLRGLLLVVWVWYGSGCGVDPGVPASPPLNPTPTGQGTTEPNDRFDQAVTVDLGTNDSKTVEGGISWSGDVDVFSLGTVSAGDRVVVTVEASGSSLDPLAALFDGNGRLMAENDDVDLGVLLQSRIDQVLRWHANPLYMAVSNSTFGPSSGGYLASVQITRGVGVPATRSQTIILIFSGGDMSVTGGTGQYSNLADFEGKVPAFSGSAIDPVYAGKDAEIMNSIVAAVQQNFSRYDVLVLRQDPGEATVQATGSRVYIGGFSADLFGIAEDVDAYNGNLTDRAIVFSELFTPDVFPTRPSAANLGKAIGNIASHEAGHLLGLNHVSDQMALMDTGSPPSSFLLDQEFIDAVLHPSIFPIGTQDAHLLLLETVGASGNQSARVLAWAEEVEADVGAGTDNYGWKGGSGLTKRDFCRCFCRKCVMRRLKGAMLGAWGEP